MTRICPYLITAALVMSACSNSKLRDLDDKDLANKRDDCLINMPDSPGRVTACENIRKECERRRQQYNYTC